MTLGAPCVLMGRELLVRARTKEDRAVWVLSLLLTKRACVRAGEVAQQIKALLLAEDPDSVSSTHMTAHHRL